MLIYKENLERQNDKKKNVKKREKSDILLTHVCRLAGSIESPERKIKYRNFQWLSLVVEIPTSVWTFYAPQHSVDMICFSPFF